MASFSECVRSIAAGSVQVLEPPTKNADPILSSHQAAVGRGSVPSSTTAELLQIGKRRIEHQTREARQSGWDNTSYFRAASTSKTERRKKRYVRKGNPE